MRFFLEIKDKIIYWVSEIKVGAGLVPAQSAERLKQRLSIALIGVY
ncbi:MAG: hypothetical protein K1X72_00430 [Pyrinomonadaceae bacterium]|nr:hypothetical protein [Pyrinomonadaceae bacterium]